jgi:hypothetical protein
MSEIDDPHGSVAKVETRVYPLHRITISRRTRGSASKKRVVNVMAYCSCGWDTPVFQLNSEMDNAIDEHLNG